MEKKEFLSLTTLKRFENWVIIGWPLHHKSSQNKSLYHYQQRQWGRQKKSKKNCEWYIRKYKGIMIHLWDT